MLGLQAAWTSTVQKYMKVGEASTTTVLAAGQTMRRGLAKHRRTMVVIRGSVWQTGVRRSIVGQKRQAVPAILVTGLLRLDGGPIGIHAAAGRQTLCMPWERAMQRDFSETFTFGFYFW